MRNHKKFEVLIVFSEGEVLKSASQIIERHFNQDVRITAFQDLVEAIEHLEAHQRDYSLIAFEHRGSSQTIIRAFIELGGAAAFLLCGIDPDVLAAFRDTELPIDFVPLNAVNENLSRAINRFEVIGKLPMILAGESDYVSVQPEFLPSMGPLEATVYVQLLDGHFVAVFNKGELVDRREVDRYLSSQKLTSFYFKREDCADVLDRRAKEMELLSSEKSIDVEKVEKSIEVSHQIVRDVIKQIGFTPEAQRVAVQSVSAAIKLMGSRPKLSAILFDMKNKDDGYITSHSLMLGKLVCAMAYQIGWSSNTTYFKLTLAAFLHDIALNDERLASAFSHEQAAQSGRFTAEELKEIRYHSTRAAEYARSISEVPADVEHIVAQHHERPDGSGFPRGLPGKLFTPLSALFVIAQDLVEYTQHQAPQALTLDHYYEAREAYFNTGVFKKILQALKTETELV